MKKMMMILLTAAFVSMTAQAQDKPKDKQPDKKFDKTEMVKHRTDETVKRYSLNDQQAKQLLDLNTKYADKMRPHHHGPHGHHGGPKGGGRPPKDGKDMKGQRPEPPKDGKRPEMGEKHKEMEATMKAYDSELQKIMTPEQFKKYKADMEKHRPTHDGKARP